MRRLIVFLLLLPLPLVSQVKILMPVVVKDASGKAVTDLQQSDFQVSGPKNVSVDKVWLVQPQTVSENDPRVPVVVLYDAANIPTRIPGGNPKEAPTNIAEWEAAALRSFLEQIADHRLPVTLLVNTKDGLRLVYDSRTPPEVLAEALAMTARSKTPAADAKLTASSPSVDEQIKNLKLLSSATWVSRSAMTASEDQLNSLSTLARLSGAIPERKALLWIATSAPVPATKLGEYWTQPDLFHRPLLPLYEALIEELNAARVTVYPLLWSWSGGPVYDSYSQESFRQIAESTGGLALNLREQESIHGAVEAVLRDFGPYYMLAVEVPTPKDLDWIPVKIKVKRPGFTVRAAPGFLGLKPQKEAKAQPAHP
ncbi:MAG TPA: VWA domain-containing protein [Alloacidobacterium sp.]|nr:VWA domain-containing protein [Alloacidobacterium sp.]